MTARFRLPEVPEDSELFKLHQAALTNLTSKREKEGMHELFEIALAQGPASYQHILLDLYKTGIALRLNINYDPESPEAAEMLCSSLWESLADDPIQVGRYFSTMQMAVLLGHTPTDKFYF